MDIYQSIISKTAEETKRLGRSLAIDITKKNDFSDLNTHILCLNGQLGSGKTTFVQGFAEGLGINERIVSPTFTVIRSYVFDRGKLFHHIDLYKFTHVEQQEYLWLRELLEDEQAFIIIEWPERLGEWLPQQRIDIYFQIVANGHVIKITQNKI